MVQSGVIIGKHVVVNANVTIDHDAVIGDFCSVYPNSYIGGGAQIGAGVSIDACSTVTRLTKVPSVFEADDLVSDLY